MKIAPRATSVVLAALLTTAALTQAAPELSDLRVEQPITEANHLYKATPGLKISFTLAKPADVTVTISRHLAGYWEHQWPWLAHPFAVRTLKLGKLGAGPHTVDWDGLDENGQPIAEVRNTRPEELEKLNLATATPRQLVTTEPVNRLQVRVEAGGETLFANIERATDTLRPNLKTLPFRSATVDREGHFLVSDFIGGCVLRYSPDWVLEMEWPRFRKGQGADPDECSDVGVDSKGNVFAMNSSGVYRYGANANGDPVPWPHQDEYMREQNFGHKLGVKTDNADENKKPGFARNFSGFAIDDKDNIYLGRREPDPCIMVFDNDGKYLRSLPVPEGRSPGKIRWVGDNTLAVTGIGHDPEGVLFFLDSQNGDVRKRIAENDPLEVWGGPDGTVLAGHGAGDVRRYNRKGEPVPFNPSLPYVKGGHEIRMYAHEVGLEDGAAGFPSNGRAYAIASDGSFAVSDTTDSIDRTTQTEITRYAADGAFLPEDVQVELGQRMPGNVYFDNQPATFEIYANNLSETGQPLTVKWTVTDFDGKKKEGTSKIAADSLARQTLTFDVDAPANGHYHLAADVLRGDRRIGRFETQFARIPSREVVENRWSPFAVCGIGESELLAQAGVKSFRGDSASWARQVEPLPGCFYGEHPEAVQFGHSGLDSLRALARSNGILLLNGLDYGEGWLGGDWTGAPHHYLYDYDHFYDYCLKVLGKFAGKGEAFYQFWNEPNFFWEPRGQPFGREHFVATQQQVWNIVKARDKDALAIADGDAGSIDMMEKFAEFGGADWNDTVQMHYPAAEAFAFDNMKWPDLPEAKGPAVAGLVDIRDKDFPGKQVWNTEEGVPATPPTAELTAVNLPRMYLSQLAAGVDKIYWFRCPQDVTGVFDEHGEVYPSYVTYATLSRLIEGAVYAGQMDLGEGAHAYLFARGNDFVLAANTIVGTRAITLDAGTPKVKVVDLMGCESEAAAPGGKLTLTISPRVQYVLLPRTSPGTLAIARGELQKRLEKWGVKSVPDLPNAIAAAAKTAATDKAAMNRLFHLVQAAETAAAAGEAPRGNPGPAAQAARAAVVKKEGPDGYLRAARLALDWTDRLAQQTQSDPTMAWPLVLAARATQAIASAEAPVYPGVTVSAFIGEPGEIERIRAIIPEKNKRETSIDDKFRFEIERKPGDPFEIELTVSNYTNHKIEGKMEPRLPQGWKVKEGSQSYSLEPGQRARFVFHVEIPQGTKSDTYSVGGVTRYQGREISEIHPSRVKL
jgi:hypothetical protein